MPKVYTREKVREQLLRHIADLTRYWLVEARASTVEAKMTGPVHSILAALDGCAVALPSFLVVPRPHETDQAFHERQGEDWYPPIPESVEYSLCDIAGELHEHWHAVYNPTTDE